MRKKAQKITALLGENGFANSDSYQGRNYSPKSRETILIKRPISQRDGKGGQKSAENFSSPSTLTDNQIDNLKCIQSSETLAPRSILRRNLKILKSSSKRHVTSLSEQLSLKYHIQRSDFSAQQQLLFTGTSSCSASATIPQDPDGLPPTHPLPPTTAADHLIPRTETIQHHQSTITGD
ncbi:hypothetical protein AVEN_274721-1 [Araneus ventricosus]|uniref:Uncharacterized protein n=1 Tax=Araneus ventricosus TaxID=182803 RepID=A0A4Y2TE34_ARAVE|nr:hypothetical protein AVEN_274721-1 [Araneus ventricosus]